MLTPYYEFDLSKIAKNIEILKSVVAPTTLYYALKANSEIEILTAIKACDCNFEVASVGEYLKLKKIGVHSSDIICSLPIKTEEMIKTLYKEGIRYFVFDDVNEYKKLKKYAPESNKILRLDITHIAHNTIPYGMDEKDIMSYINQGIIEIENINGLTFYLSSNNDVNLVLSTLTYCERIIEIVGDNKILNVGGNYRLPEEVGMEYYSLFQQKLNCIREKHHYRIYMEPGRSIVKNAGKLVTTVVDIKDKQHQVFLDAGLPTGISYCPNCIVNATGATETMNTKYDFFDITCSHRLLFSTEINFKISVGDVLEFLNFGSYSICKSSNFHGWETPKCYYRRKD